METRTLMEPVSKYYFGIEVGDSDIAILSRKIRDWLGQNCGCTWETKWIKDTDKHIDVVGVYFDMDTAEEDLMAFILAWT